MRSPFTTNDSVALRAAVQQDLDRVCELASELVPGVTVALGGSFAQGEAVAWMQEDRLRALSDYDIFLVLPGSGSLARVAALRSALARLAPDLANPRLDVNLQLPWLARGAWQPRDPFPVLAGPALEAGPADPASRYGFALHTLHAAQLGLLACAPGVTMASSERRYRINRCALGAMRGAWNLEADRPVYSFGACREPLEGDWGRGLEDAQRALLLQALEENPGLGLANEADLEPGALTQRWALARLTVALMHERWSWKRAEADASGRRALLRERLKGLPRLAMGSLRSQRLPGPVVDAHPLLLEARRSLLDAVLPGGGLDRAWLERAQRRLSRLGLGPRRWSEVPQEAWQQAVRAAALPNPARLVLGME